MTQKNNTNSDSLSDLLDDPELVNSQKLAATEKKPNPQQEEAINFLGKPLLILAGAGSGKTETVSNKVVNVINSGVKPERICMLTFTNKAAQNMVERIAKKVPEAINICAGTFHGISYRLLCEVGFETGFYQGEQILSTYQTSRIWEKVYQTEFSENERGDIRKLKLGGIKQIQKFFSRLKTHGFDESELEERVPETKLWKDFKKGCLDRMFTHYKTLKRDYKGFDFDDILCEYFSMLLHKEMRTKIQDKFDYIFVDEFQDTSWIQNEILKCMAGAEKQKDGYEPKLTVVGDPNQCIYSFLSSQVGNILNFKSDFPNAKIVKLNVNYRSIPGILNLSNNILTNNKEAVDNPLEPFKNGKVKPVFHKYGSARTEAIGIIRDIKTELENGRKPEDIAVLSRLSFTTRNLEMELTKENIPFVKVGGIKITDKINVRRFLAYLELCLNKHNWLAWEVLLPMIPLIGKELSSQIIDDLSANSDWTWDTPPPVSLGAGKRWKSFQEFWNIIKKVDELKTVKEADFMKEAYTRFRALYAYYWKHATPAEKKKSIEEDKTLTDLDQKEFKDSEKKHTDEFLNKQLLEIEEYIVNMSEQRGDTLRQFLDQFHLQDSSGDLPEDYTKGKITLSTIHSAKGLEWPVVFVVGLEMGTLPVSGRTYGKPESNNLKFLERYRHMKPHKELPYMEEENRLFYVAVTRAEEVLHVTFAAQRMGRGLKDSIFLNPFKPKGIISGTMDLGTHLFVLEKMRTDEDNSKFKKSKPKDNK